MNSTQGIRDECFAAITMHRPSNVDRRDILSPLVEFLSGEVCKKNAARMALTSEDKRQFEKVRVMEKGYGYKEHGVAESSWVS